MALTPQNSDAFLREVDDDLRRDRMVGLWRRWGRVAIVALLAFLVALALGLWWRSHRAAQAEGYAEQLAAITADAEGKRIGATDPRLVALASSSRGPYAELARLTQAGIVAASNPPRAAQQFQAIADDGAVPQPMRDLALLRAVTLQLDTLPPRQVIDRLRPLAQPGGPWYGSAGELTAAAWLKLNRRDLAGPLFAALARDPTVPASLRGRAANMATALGQAVGPLAPSGALKE